MLLDKLHSICLHNFNPTPETSSAHLQPQVLKLVGPDVATAYWTLGFVSVQLFLSYTIKDLDWMYVIPVAATVGGLIAQSLTLAMHEISHNLAFRTQLPNLMLGIFANLPMGLPAFG